MAPLPLRSDLAKRRARFGIERLLHSRNQRRETALQRTAALLVSFRFVPPAAAEGRYTMKLRDWFELVRIQLHREEGQTMAEYGLLIALVAIVVIGAITLLGNNLTDAFNNIAGSL
jgi:pilus assembly protein Flp/PilA